MKKIILAVTAALLLPFGAQAGDITAGSTPRTINYQGRLERDNAPITGTIHLYFRVYNHLTNSGAGVCGGVNQPCLWLSPEITVEATQGVFSATLEFSEADLLYVFSRPQTLYLEVQVESDVLAPREPMSSVAYAMVAKKLEDGSSVSVTSFTANYQVLLATAAASNVGIGTNSPSHKLTIIGSVKLSGAASQLCFDDNTCMPTAGVGAAVGGVTSPGASVVESGTGGAGALSFKTSNVERLRVHDSSLDGRVGIGTAAIAGPMGTLDVSGALYVGNEGIYDRDDAEVNVKEDLVVEGGQLRGIGDNYITLGETANTIIAGTNGTDRLWLTAAGNLGAGASAPASERIYASGNMRATTGVRGGSVSIGAYSNTWTGAANEVRAADATHLLLQQNNPYYVGIGTDTPREKLHVRGSVLADYGVRAGTGVFTNDVNMSGNLTANGNNKQVFLTSTTIYGTLSVTGGIGSAAGFPAYIASTQTFTGQNIFENQVEVSSDILTVNRIGVGVTDFDFAGAKYLQVGDDKAEYSNDDALAYLVGGDNADAVLNFYRGGTESARIETQTGRNLAVVVEGQTKTLTDKTYHRIQNSSLWVSTGFASTPAIYTSSSMGNVGMGTTVMDPNWRLTVEGNLRISTISSPGQSYGLIFADGTMLTTAGGGSATGLSNNSDAVIQSDADQSGSGSVLLRAGSLDGLVLNSGGNVGIGTVNPVSKLNIRGGDLVLGTPVNPYAVNSQEDLIVGGHIVFDGALIQRSASAVELSNLIVANSVFLSTAAAVNQARTSIGTNVLATLPTRLYVAGGDINVDSAFGLRINNTAPVREYLRGDGTRYESSLIQALDVPLAIARTTTTISTTLPLAGGGDISANRTFTIGGLSSLGTANYVVGANNGATGWEYKQITGSASEIDITHTAGGIEIGIIDPLIVGKGGTGVATFLTNGVLYGNGTGAVQDTPAGTQYQVLRANATGVPVFGSINLDQAAAVTGILPVGNGGTGVGATLDGVLRGNLTGVVTAMAGTANIMVKWSADGKGLINSNIEDDGTTLDVATRKIINVVNPTNNQDAATKTYVDSQIGGVTGVVWHRNGDDIIVSNSLGSTDASDIQIITSNATRMYFTAGGNVGMGGNTAPDAPLHLTGGACFDSDAICTNPGGGNVHASGNVNVDGKIKEGGNDLMPAGAIIMWGTDTACPTGWTEYTGARGRYLVGVPSPGTVGTAPGAAFTSGQQVGYTPAGTVSAPSFTGSSDVTTSNGAHSHGGATGNENAHTHGLAATTAGTFTGGGAVTAVTGVTTPSNAGSSHGHSITGAIDHNHTATPAGTVGTPTFSGTGATINVPYIQLRLCQKN